MQAELFTRDEKALVIVRNLVNALGVKEVAAKLRPKLSPEKGGQWVNQCLNPGRREKFSAEDLIRMLIGARQLNHHDGINELAKVCGYQNPAPKSPDESRCELMTEVRAAQEQIKQRFEELEELHRIEKGEW